MYVYIYKENLSFLKWNLTLEGVDLYVLFAWVKDSKPCLAHNVFTTKTVNHCIVFQDEYLTPMNINYIAKYVTPDTNIETVIWSKRAIEKYAAYRCLWPIC